MSTVLEIADLHAYYGKSHILRGVDLSVTAGAIVAVIGRNGVGRSTLAKAITGEIAAKGLIHFNGRDILGLDTHQIAGLGIGYVPESRDIFPMMSVRDNLSLGIKDPSRPGRWSIDQMFEMFPNLAARADTAAGVLSGGEQQMLTICRSLLGDPELLIIDEPTEGLAPKIVAQVEGLISQVARSGVTILLIEQKLPVSLRLADQVHVMGHGRVVFSGTPSEFRNRDDIRREWLEV